MKNRDMPANPIMLENGEVWDEEHDHANGLTKREYAAIEMAKAMLSNPVMGDSALHPDAASWLRDVNEAAIEFADDLFDRLEES